MGQSHEHDDHCEQVAMQADLEAESARREGGVQEPARSEQYWIGALCGVETSSMLRLQVTKSSLCNGAIRERIGDDLYQSCQRRACFRRDLAGRLPLRPIANAPRTAQDTWKAYRAA